jgi:hypothetical protein
MDVKNEGMPLTVTVFAYPFYPEIDLRDFTTPKPVRLVSN